MKFTNEDRTTLPRRRLLPVLVVVVALLATALVAMAASPLSEAGWLNHSYASPPNSITEPTGKGAESKLWFHDGYWWGVLFSPSQSAFTIHRLDRASHDWVNTSVVVDTRITDANNRASRADVLWDAASGKLFIATHLKVENPSNNNNPDNRAKLRRYSYDDAANTWTLDPGFQNVTINNDVTETLVLDKDSTGRLWITYISRTGSGNPYDVYVNASSPTDHTSWGAPFVLNFDEAKNLDMDDISALAAFTDASGPKVAVMWSDQSPPVGQKKFYIAVRPDSAGDNPQSGWDLEPGLTNLFTVDGDDHIKLSPAPGNLLLATIKTGATVAGDPLIAVVKRAPNGAYTLHPVALVTTQDTRPTMAVDAYNNQVHVFSVSKEGGGYICIQSAGLPALDFGDTYNCPPPPNAPAPAEILAPQMANVIPSPVIIGDNVTYFTINDPTTAKHWLTEDSGIAVLASDETHKVYAHNVLGGTTPPPPPPPGDERLYLPLILRN